jgi:hypothetical protein
MIDYQHYKIDFSKFNLSTEQFDHPSWIHGIKHTYRVMIHCLRLGKITGKVLEAKNAFFGAYIHDMARLHDGYCTRHGADAARFKLPLYYDLFNRYGANSDDLKVIQQIVTWHSLPNEPSSDHSIWSTLAILKDADALDRIRLGEHDLNPDYLRHLETHKSIMFGEELFYKTDNFPLVKFSEVIEKANLIEN